MQSHLAAKGCHEQNVHDPWPTAPRAATSRSEPSTEALSWTEALLGVMRKTLRTRRLRQQLAVNHR